MKPKNIDLTNKCGSCCHFEPIEGTCSGYCLRNKYGENVTHDPEHPYWQVQRSRMKCVDYNKKPMTNADHIRSMTDEEFAKRNVRPIGEYTPCFKTSDGAVFWSYKDAIEYELHWLRQPYKEDT